MKNNSSEITIERASNENSHKRLQRYAKKIRACNEVVNEKNNQNISNQN